MMLSAETAAFNLGRWPGFLGAFLSISLITMSMITRGFDRESPESKSIHDRFDTHIVLAWSASLIVFLTSIFNYRFATNVIAFSNTMLDSAPSHLRTHLHPERFLRLSPFVFIAGLLATIAIYFNFIAGMLCYLIMHVLCMSAYSGLIIMPSLSRAKWQILEETGLKIRYIIVLAAYVVAVPTIFFVLVFKKPDSLVTLPYMIVLTSMSCVTALHLFSYSNRPLLMRLIPFVGSVIFVFSDMLIGHKAFQEMHPCDFLIDFTYVWAITLLNMGILFYNSKWSNDEKTGSSIHQPILSDQRMTAGGAEDPNILSHTGSLNALI
eukprot:TRINITY_DN7631_c0_g1_i1.p1 TRINITY_DN7631_c0_g1~~TRINITY_DN7631_c0_g1_i1.p1  ORF type:complete len:322 (+),score=37.36 TRINITY_DN7631_c0_g1_i1:189-1154(+)